ncbi:hypothetical protein TrST_g2667 [Triparma strigata]|uniref:V-type proton ATPase subunit a n=1 Tax=Triparma strigata TaxID=1606541 RepID=A0A9W7ET71_9STRA|nr:hypothetical protein TrST_g2667 [Triparma strigata]
MTAWFRSAPMSYVSLILHESCSHDTLTELGKLGIFSFTDLNPDLTPFQRRYVTSVKRCDELERKLRFFTSECDKFSLLISQTQTVPTFLSRAGDKGVLTSLEGELEGYEMQLRELNTFNEKLTREYNEKVELQEVLLKSQLFYDTDAPRLMTSSIGGGSEDRGRESLLKMEHGGEQNDMRFSSITGCVLSDEKLRFERMIFRSTRGNCYLRFAEIEQDISDPETGNPSHKHVFIIFYKSRSIEGKIKKICDAFSAHRYSIPSMDDVKSVTDMMERNRVELEDSHRVLMKNQDTRFRMCQMLAGSVEEWKWKVVKEKSVYHSLNMFKSDVSGMLRGEGWIIASQLESAREAVSQTHASSDASMPSLLQVMPQPWPQPPTHFDTNEFTYAYQEFVNTYGIPRYREANPALFTAATFPFLFGVMYGDIGHGSCLAAGGLYLMFTYDRDKRYDEMIGGMFQARYMITAMGFMGVYAGIIYNDFFSLGLNLFTSRYYYENEEMGAEAIENGQNATLTADYGTSDAIYPMGMDPAWHVSSNELLFFNSFKMKLSVILGIAQMFMGTCLKGANALYFNERLDFFFEFLPMVAFSASLFIYMVVLIIMKWSINWQSRMLSATCVEVAGPTWGSPSYQEYEGVWNDCGAEYCSPGGIECEVGVSTTADLCPLDYGGSGDGCQPPNLITLLINIALQPGTVDEPLYANQPAIQNFLLLVAFVSVPILLLAKPYLLSKQHSEHTSHGDSSSTNSDTPLGPSSDAHDEGEEHGFGEILIHQAIETIEFVLGMVSNTASYLRLWALSLAHSKLAGVFWEKAMLSTINMNFFAAFIGFGIFAAVTTGVLLMMDVLECFLHALRLHWVEFQNKFFKADGVRFVPFCFKQILNDASAAV